MVVWETIKGNQGITLGSQLGTYNEEKLSNKKVSVKRDLFQTSAPLF
jgi:hypothetical protein